MTPFTVAPILLGWMAVIAAQSPTLDDATIGEAMSAGRARRYEHLVSRCTAASGWNALWALVKGPTGNFDVIVSLAAGRIAHAAAEGEVQKIPLSRERLTAEMRDPTKVFVTAMPDESPPGATLRLHNTPIEQILLRSKTNPSVMAWPDRLEFIPLQGFPSQHVGTNSRLAIFSLARVRDLPPGEFDVVIVIQAGERRCKVGRRDRARLFK